MMRDRDKGLGDGEVQFINHAILFDRTGQVLNITDAEVQRALLEKCKRDGIKLVIIDNLSTLASGIKENDSFEWEQLHNWLLQFRRHGIAVILVHHAGRNGEARGTSKREDAAFWVIALDDARKHADSNRGATFISRFTKPSRNTQEEIPAFEWHVVSDPVTGEVSVSCKVAQSMDVLRQWIESGVTECGQLAEEMGVSKGTISKLAKQAMKAGWLTKKNREYVLVEATEMETDPSKNAPLRFQVRHFRFRLVSPSVPLVTKEAGPPVSHSFPQLSLVSCFPPIPAKRETNYQPIKNE